MRIQLPSIISGSTTPTSSKFPESQSILKPRIRKSQRIVSVSPKKILRSLNESPVTPLAPRPISDEVNNSITDKDSMLLKVYSKMSKRSKGKLLSKYVPNMNNFSEVIDALFSIFKCEQSRIESHNLISLFISLGLSDSPQDVAKILLNICEVQDIDYVSFSRIDLLRLCEDWKTEHVLRILKREAASVRNGEGKVKLDILIGVVNKWWNKIDRAKNGFVSVDEILNFYNEIGIVENSNDIKRLFIKMPKFCNFSLFSSLFAKSLFKFMMEELASIIKAGSSNFLSGEISIITQRRKQILNSLAGYNKIIAAMKECKTYN